MKLITFHYAFPASRDVPAPSRAALRVLLLHQIISASALAICRCQPFWRDIVPEEPTSQPVPWTPVGIGQTVIVRPASTADVADARLGQARSSTSVF